MNNPYEIYLGENNRGYYLFKFEQFDNQGNGRTISWNWAAFLFTGVWALYRKLYPWFWVFTGLMVFRVILALAPVLMSVNPTVYATLGVGSAVLYLVVWLGFALYANSLYHRHVKAKIDQAESSIRDETTRSEYLRFQGGVNRWVIWGGVALFLLVVFGPMVAVHLGR